MGATSNLDKRRWLVPFPLLAIVVGLGYAFGGPARNSYTLFNPAEVIMPVAWWGWVFIGGAVVMAGALWLGRPLLMTSALVVGGGVFIFWGITFLIAALSEPAAPLSPWAKDISIGLAHYYAAYRTHHRVQESRLLRGGS